MRIFIKILLFVLVSFITNVVSATTTFTSLQTVTVSFSFHKEITKSVFKVIENDLTNCCQNEENIVAYRNWGAGVKAVAAKGGTSAARLSTNGVKLTQQLASEAQMSQAGRTIISNLRSEPRLAQQYGGKAADWVKKSSSSFNKNGKIFETHWYQNVSTGQRVEFKTKLIQGW